MRNVLTRETIGAMRHIAITLILSACAHYAPFTPASVAAPTDPFNKSVRVLIQHGESIQTKDEGAGMIVTAWKDESSMGSDRHLRWTVTIADGIVTVTSQCERKLSGEPAPGQSNNWEDCGNQPGDRTGQAKRIADEIAR